MQPCILFVLFVGITITSSCGIPNAEQTKTLNGKDEQIKVPEVAAVDAGILEHKSQLNAASSNAQSTTIPTVDFVPENIVPLPTRSPTATTSNEKKKVPEVSTEDTILEHKSAQEDIHLFRMEPQSTPIPTVEKILPLPTRCPYPKLIMMPSTIVNTEQVKTPNGGNPKPKLKEVALESATHSAVPEKDKNIPDVVGNQSIECEPQPYSIGTRLSAQLLKILTRLG
ncbi:uncharacterized protein LOC117897532 [Drosophila subobscura]|uniref:uncharacterized protein LOC117897532 n=1 Tax=Drosophila subobscura TaxID=7241 RepID=UPI00155B1DAC|nr:uncharacterized protein LOC117897532 [Drosophila subobscura]